MTLKLISLHKLPNFLPFTFAGNKKPIAAAFFSADSKRIFSVGENGTLLLWKWSSDARSKESQAVLEHAEFKMGKRLKVGSKPNEYKVTQGDTDLFTELEREASEGRFLLEKKSKFALQGGSKIVSCAVSARGGLTSAKLNKVVLVIGQSNGVFSLYDLDTLNSIHSFQISQNKIDSVSINAAGDWIALASKEQGQLFVWEWQSETYVLKQQGHFFDLNTLAYSPDGNFLATGGDDGKVKLWTTKNCLCFATFSEHTGKVTAL